MVSVDGGDVKVNIWLGGWVGGWVGGGDVEVSMEWVVGGECRYVEVN